MKKDLVEIFGYAPEDLSFAARSLWNLGACPFVSKACIKINHDQSIIYGTYSVTSPHGDVIICPNRFYADKYAVLRQAAEDAFGSIPFLLFIEYIEQRDKIRDWTALLLLARIQERRFRRGGAFR